MHDIQEDPGPMLDAEMATIMGYESSIGNIESCFPGKLFARTRPQAPCEYDRWIIYNPSTDIHLAMQIAEKFRMVIFPITDGKWAAATVDHSSAPVCIQHGDHYIDDSISNIGKASTIAYAICLCALKAHSFRV